MARKCLAILITSAGRRVGLLQCFRAAAERLDVDLTIIACDLNPDESAACALADHAAAVPRCDSPDYATSILEIVRQHGVSLVIPTIDPELMPLAQAAPAFANLGARVHVSPVNVIEVVRDKRLTIQKLSEAGVPVPRTLDHQELLERPQDISWPIFAKPSGGSASRGLDVFETLADVPSEFPEPMIFQDKLNGPEYTINMFVDASGQLCTVIPHLRIQIRAGEVEKGETRRRNDLQTIAEGIAQALPDLRGVACFQIIDDPEHGPAVLEINARFGGGYPLADHAGAQFAQWLLEEVAELPSTANNNWRDGVKMMRYDSAVYQG
ncbi:ATP-grasp domain-containing protein [Ruegeria faecimaris]|uniref:Carbamoyl-phosphate synthase large subunit n=1 Tax=Ruegeria faecimaris TaxID=686389 RepID=A0A521CP51_9RHOB|nr:ATP-grasp domain-containing protein [Ruegeria faecimaris]SMO61234.1 carbamoyl-phosphate synthase large subunit [Ruegeria faecimaris]